MGDLVLQSEISPEQSDGKNKSEVLTKEETFKIHCLRDYTHI